MTIHSSLKQTFGFSQFRPGQEQCVMQLVHGNSSLAVFPTGSGKSLCYQLAALQLPNLTLVVSPLLALIKDQLDFLKQKGIPAGSIDSTLSFEEQQQITADTRSGKIKILMISVERFKNERFRQFIQSVPLSMLVVDEAHCISEWGHNFRPDYLKLPQYRQDLKIPLVLLLTATATKKVKEDMAEKFNIQPEHVVQTGFYRSNLNMDVIPVSESEKKGVLLQHVSKQTGPGVVYVTLQNTAVDVAEFLRSNGVQAEAYHAGFKSENREAIQNRFMNGQTDVIVATIAFGMGIDKSDIRFVIHYNLPKSIENYSQEIGRAGRDGNASNCIALSNLDGLSTLENFVYGDTPELDGIEGVLEDIRNQQSNSQWEMQINSLSTACNVRQLPLKTLLVQLELIGVVQPTHSYYAEYKFKYIQSLEFILEQFHGERREFLHHIFNNALMKKVWGELRFDLIQNGYNCDRHRIISALDYLHEKQWIELQARNMTEVYRINQGLLENTELAPQLHHYFKDKEEKEIERIASLVKFFESNSCLSHKLAKYFDDPDAPAKCGHCSVCEGRVAKLPYSSDEKWPGDKSISEYLQGLQKHISDKQGSEAKLSVESKVRFLTGISIPLFTRNRVKGLDGFGCCESFRYADVKAKIERSIEFS